MPHESCAESAVSSTAIDGLVDEYNDRMLINASFTPDVSDDDRGDDP